MGSNNGKMGSDASKNKSDFDKYGRHRLIDIYIPGYGLPWKERLRWPKRFFAALTVFIVAQQISFAIIKPQVIEEQKRRAAEQDKWEFDKLVEVERALILKERAKVKAKAKAEQENLT